MTTTSNSAPINDKCTRNINHHCTSASHTLVASCRQNGIEELNSNVLAINKFSILYTCVCSNNIDTRSNIRVLDNDRGCIAGRIQRCAIGHHNYIVERQRRARKRHKHTMRPILLVVGSNFTVLNSENRILLNSNSRWLFSCLLGYIQCVLSKVYYKLGISIKSAIKGILKVNTCNGQVTLKCNHAINSLRQRIAIRRCPDDAQGRYQAERQ